MKNYKIKKKMFQSFLQNALLHKPNLSYYINITVIIAGLATNLIAIMIFIRKKLNTNTNIGVMHSILCFFNIIPLLNSIILIQTLPSLANLNLIAYSNFSCKLVSFNIRAVSFFFILGFMFKNGFGYQS